MIHEQDLTPRIDQLYRERYDANARRCDRLFAGVMIVQWIFAVIVAVVISPYTWAGREHAIHAHVYIAVFLGGALSTVPVLLAVFRPGWVVTRYTIACSQMIWSALLIHLFGGRLETHFHVFGSLAFLAFYRDWKVLLPATVIVAADHVVRQFFWPESVYGISSPEWWRFLEHAGWVVFEDVFLVIACIASNREMRQLANQQIAIEAHERATAARLQTSILPRTVAVMGLEASAQMIPAELVGGDYYDVLPVDGGCWIAIGDVAGHGTQAGLTMLQAQSALSALVHHSPNAHPADLWASLNHTYFDNVRNRMKQDEHMTLSLLRYYDGGRFQMVGAHEELVIWRAATGKCELVPLLGTWIGVTQKSVRDEQTFQLAPNDLLVLYTDGIIEAQDRATGKRVGIDRLVDLVAKESAQTVEQIRDAIFVLAGTEREDDASVIVFRYVGEAAVAVAA